MSSYQAHPAPTAPIAGAALLRKLADNWWLLLLRGIAAIVFGVLAFVWPVLTLLTLTFLWGAYAIADGILARGKRSPVKAVMWDRVSGLPSLASPGSSPGYWLLRGPASLHWCC